MARRKRIVGASRLKRKLKRMPENITQEIREVIADGSQKVLGDMKTRAPSSRESAPRDWEGRSRLKLRDALEARISKDGLLARIGIMGKKNRKSFFFVPFLEFGTKHMIARPFMRPAWTRWRQYIRRNIRKATIRALRKTAGDKVSDV